jgi:hypothetical protein
MRDCNGLVIAVRNWTRLGNLEPIKAEALIAFQSVEFSLELWLHNVILEGDAFQVVNAMNFTG